jgi:hypothetical protein
MPLLPPVTTATLSFNVTRVLAFPSSPVPPFNVATLLSDIEGGFQADEAHFALDILAVER